MVEVFRSVFRGFWHEVGWRVFPIVNLEVVLVDGVGAGKGGWTSGPMSPVGTLSANAYWPAWSCRSRLKPLPQGSRHSIAAEAAPTGFAAFDRS